MHINHRDYPPPGEIDGVIDELYEQAYAFRTETHLVSAMLEAARHLESYRDILRKAYVEHLRGSCQPLQAPRLHTGTCNPK